MFRFGSELIEVSIEDCVHYCGFRYGHGEYNPYETYTTGLHAGRSRDDIQVEFMEFLLHYRPGNFGEALGLRLIRAYPWWTYPWEWRALLGRSRNAWRDSFDSIPDILTHFSSEGVSRMRAEEEFFWLERAYRSISECGYLPEKHSYVHVCELRHTDGQKKYLLRDGNHRVSAMSALGYKTFVAQHARNDSASLSDIAEWAGIRWRNYDIHDAIEIFNAYFKGNHAYRTSATAAKLIP